MNGSLSGDSTVFPNSVLFHCDPGLILSGSTKRTCQVNGTWSGSPTICSGRLIPTVAKHTVYFCINLCYGLVIFTFCIFKRHSTYYGSLTRPGFCPLFPAVDCGHLAAPMNGSLSGDSTVFPNSVLFNCDPGFILNGSSSRTCQANGTWSGLSTVCLGRFEIRVVLYVLTLLTAKEIFTVQK